MIDLHTNILYVEQEARVALRTFDKLSHSTSRTLFIINGDKRMVGSLTDGDIRRGLLNGLEISQPISFFMNVNFKFIDEKEKDNLKLIKSLRQKEIYLIPLLDCEKRITQILDLRKVQTVLPVSALIMAGGRGERLKPFTNNIPKPMLLIGDKPIIEHNIDRLIKYGVKQIFISVRYLKNQLIDYFGDGSSKGISIIYIEEDEPLGTLGCLSLINEIENDDIIVMNSDILTNIDFEDFFEFYKESESKMVVASVPYVVNIPYAVLETDHNHVKSFVEKPTYTYYSNGGIYILKIGLKNYLNKNEFYNATDLMDRLLLESKISLSHYPLLCYWLDIGKQQDYIKAQEDIKHLNF
jgi:dTDP-glucose pyrophosphorylase